MAKDYRLLKFEYNSITTEIYVRLSLENISPLDLFSDVFAIDGTKYRQITGETFVFDYNFPYASKLIYDFFNDAYIFNKAGGSVDLLVEQDDDTFETYNVIVSRPVPKDFNRTSDSLDKVYQDLLINVEGK